MEDGYTLERTNERDADLFYTLVQNVWEGIEDKRIFSVQNMGQDWYERHLKEPSFGILARDKNGMVAGILIVVIPDEEEGNLGKDIGLPEKELSKVVHMDTSAVLPEHRGHRLEQRMLVFAEECLKGTPFIYMLCTISPDNEASLISAKRIGYRVATTKEKYSGMIRHILFKKRIENT